MRAGIQNAAVASLFVRASAPNGANSASLNEVDALEKEVEFESSAAVFYRRFTSRGRPQLPATPQVQFTGTAHATGGTSASSSATDGTPASPSCNAPGGQLPTLESKRSEDASIDPALRSPGSSSMQGQLLSHASSLSSIASAPGDADASRRLMLIENAFFHIDKKARGWIELRDVSRFLSFARLDMGPAERHAALNAADKHGDARFVRLEFMDVCSACLSHTPCAEIELALQNFALAQDMVRALSTSIARTRNARAVCQCALLRFLTAAQFTRRNSLQWQKLAIAIDQWSRMSVIVFILTLVLLFNMTLEDHYDNFVFESNSSGTVGENMFSLFAPSISISWVGIFAIALAPIIAVIFVVISGYDYFFYAVEGTEETKAGWKRNIRARMTQEYAKQHALAQSKSLQRTNTTQDNLRKLFHTDRHSMAGRSTTPDRPSAAARQSATQGSDSSAQRVSRRALPSTASAAPAPVAEAPASARRVNVISVAPENVVVEQP